MKVGLVCTSRFHFFDLARQLDRHGVFGRIFSGYPLSRLQGERLLEGSISSFPWFTTLVVAAAKTGRMGLTRPVEWLSNDRLDRWASSRLTGLDTLIAVSGNGLHSGRRMQAQGGKWICDRGAAHILAQEQILREEHERRGVPYVPIDQRKVAKELAEYSEADSIFVCSEFVRQTFLQQGSSPDKVRSLPLGVDVSRFAPSAPKSDGFRVLMAGQISLQKGIGVVAEAAPHFPKGMTLALAGAPTPEADRFVGEVERHVRVERLGSIAPSDLADEMSRASLLLLPSVQDGFGMVVPQAMACGTPCLVSSHAGACEVVRPGETGWVFPSGNAESLAEFLGIAASDPRSLAEMGQRARESVVNLGGWDAYGDAVMQELARLAQAKPPS